MEAGSPDAELQASRLAAEERDWNGCLAVTEELLLRLPASRAVRRVRQVVERHLPTFERHQPGVRWPRELIESIRDEEPLDDGGGWPEEEDDHPGPGANNFTRAVENLWRASRSGAEAQQRTEALGSAIASVILAEEMESWGSRHPEEWSRWYELASAGGNDPRVPATQLTLMRDPESMRLERAAWMEIAAPLEEALGER
ncbi:hypothetical protein JQX13_18845 [Archangium violaceum]|uniref:hypothetical protein n=1 Tax=Archangium violaceum TaxID=83451 RepID=UPI00193B4C5E|nr:hypothetical protein [Archangium violaceum]QRK11928.1 hypothetical protein JQX13_18845 [Archangium violaceum]